MNLMIRLATKLRSFLCDHLASLKTIRGEMGERYIELACPKCGQRHRVDDVLEAQRRKASATGRGPSLTHEPVLGRAVTSSAASEHS